HLGNISLQHNSPAMSFAAANSEGRFEVGLAVPGQPGVLAATPTNDADASAVSTVESSIRSVLDDQVRAWNNGDIPGFMRGYWESPQLSFASGGTMTSGWAATMQRYKRRYTDAKTMGTLQFDDLSVHPFGTQHAYVTGQWTLTRENDKPRGRFTLLFQKMPIGWRIIHDHTSAAETPE
ncbi:MAG: nuclear transport factor 2 family protein, partial [Planctomycetota bacterium]